MIDWKRIDELRSEIGEDTFTEVAELFVEEVDQVISQLRVGEPERNLHDTMHFLKGCALNLGFTTFGKLCLKNEKLLETGEESVDLASVLHCYDQSRAEFVRTVMPERIRSQIRPVSDHP